MPFHRHIRDHRVLLALLAIVLALVATHAWAVVLYKLTDRAGNVTYVDRLPAAFDGSVERLDIDTSRPAAAAPRPETSVARSLRQYEQARAEFASSEAARESRIRQARMRAAAARDALLVAQESSSPEDWIYVPNGRVPRPEYEARLAQLEANVRQAEEDLRAAERG